MIRIEFSDEDIETLDYERYHYPHPKVQKKMEVLYLKAMGLSHQEICRLSGISHSTLVSYLNQYLEGGIERLKQLGYQGKSNELSAHETSLKAYFEKHPPVNIAEAQAVIEKLTGIKRKPTQIRAFLKRIGMKCRKVGSIPGKALDPDKIEEQESFKKQELEPRLEEAKAGQRKVYFMDAAHFVFGAFLGFVWCFERLFIPSPSGRKRFNVLGALDAVTNELITITNDSYINSRSVCKMLDKIAQINQGLGIPITIFFR